jgi:hypothetical protein
MNIANIEMKMYNSEARVQLIDAEETFTLNESNSLLIEGVYDSSFHLTPWGADMVVSLTDPSVHLDNGEKLIGTEVYAKHRDFKLIL